MPNLGIWFPAKDGGNPANFALLYAAGLVKAAPHSRTAGNRSTAHAWKSATGS